MPRIDPAEVLQGVTVIAAPHMDDGVLACGGTIARLPDKHQVHVVYATDGAQSPIPMFPWQGSASADLPAIRRQEARNALQTLGLPADNIHFLNFPDGRLRYRLRELSQALAALLATLRPAWILSPFRHDRHPDHLALHRATTRALQTGFHNVNLAEYFVYYRWQLLPGKDVRRLIRPEHLLTVDIEPYARQKRRALACFTSQTTLFFDWQVRPILPAHRLDEVSRTPEYFLRYQPRFPGARVYTGSRAWIWLVYWIEPFLKKRKDQLVNLRQRGRSRGGCKSQ